MVFNRFRWVFCQLETLRNCLPQNVRGVLKELPKSLDETYERMLKEIGKVNPRQAHRLLQCVTVAERPLRVEELAEVLALDFDTVNDGIPALNKDWRWDDEKQGVLATCSSLVVIVDGADSDSWGHRVVQFAHFSVKEFLTSDRLASLKTDISHFHIRLEPAHTAIAQACLAILLRSDYNEVGSPLLKYAARHCVAHAQFENVSSRVKDGLRHLFDPAKPYFPAWLKSYNVDKQWLSFLQDSLMYHLSLFSKPTLSIGDCAPLCLYYASLCGFLDLTDSLIAEYPQHLNVDRVGYNKTPLVAALHNRHWQVAELLHRNGATVDVTGDQDRTPLHAASKDGIVDIARWLLDHGADANSQENDHSTSLHLAVANGHLELVRTLLEHGADVNAATRDNRTPLHEASKAGHIDIVRLLIQHRADTNTHLQRLLILASSSGSVETAQLFIQLGADVNFQDGDHSTPLHLASSNGNTETVRLLVQLGADVNSDDGNHSRPLHLASSSSNAEISQLLIKRGADIHARDGNLSAPLHLASSMGNADAVQLLIEHGADVNARDESDKTPLHLALSPVSSNAVIPFISHWVNGGTVCQPLDVVIRPKGHGAIDSAWRECQCTGSEQLDAFASGVVKG